MLCLSQLPGTQSVQKSLDELRNSGKARSCARVFQVRFNDLRDFPLWINLEYTRVFFQFLQQVRHDFTILPLDSQHVEHIYIYIYYCVRGILGCGWHGLEEQSF